MPTGATVIRIYQAVYTSTSSSSVNITGSIGTNKTFVVTATVGTAGGLGYSPGQTVIAASAANPTVNNIIGLVVSFDGVNLVLDITIANGSGAHTDWQLSLEGPTGAQGYSPQWIVAAGAPSGATGNNGDMYLNSTTDDVYGPKTSGAWGGIVANIKGLTGASSVWRSGSGVPSSGLGNNGDMYLNTSTGDVYGPKSGGAWGSIVENIVGPPGGGMTDPGSNGILFRPALNTTRVAIADDLGAPLYALASGTNSLTATLSPAITAYTTGVVYRLKCPNANTGAVTINLNSLGAITLKKPQGGVTTDLVANDIQVGQFIEFIYDGANMQMLSQLGNIVVGGPSAQSIANPWFGTPTTSRALNTTYQNTFRTPIYVSVSVNNANSDVTSGITDSSSSPTTEVVRVENQSSTTTLTLSLFFVVLPGNYYQVKDTNFGTLVIWTEWK